MTEYGKSLVVGGVTRDMIKYGGDFLRRRNCQSEQTAMVAWASDSELCISIFSCIV